MAAPKGHKRYGGRTKGTLNKATADIKTIAQHMTPAATQRLGKLLESPNEAVALGAVREVYDRAFGKATQHVQGGLDAVLQIITNVPRAGGDHG